jgi:cytochrome c551
MISSRFRLIIMIFFAFSLICVCVACDNQTSDEWSTTKDAPTIYTNYCLSCHGSNLEGFRGPNLQEIGSRMNEEEIINKIEKGGNGMPGFKVSLKESDIQILAQWLAEKK